MIFTLDIDDLDWINVDNQLLDFGRMYLGEALRLELAREFTEGSAATAATDSRALGSNPTSTMLANVETELAAEPEGESSFFIRILDRWKCDGGSGCANVTGNCYRNEQHQHFKLLAPDIRTWAQAVQRK